MGKVIEMPTREVPVRWYIDISAGKEFIRCRYVEAGESVIRDVAHWRVVVEANTIDRLCVLLKKAEVELAKSKAARRQKGRQTYEAL